MQCIDCYNFTSLNDWIVVFNTTSWGNYSIGEDNCPYNDNIDQKDLDGDGVGDVCDRESAGNCGGNIECFCNDTLAGNWVMVRDLRDRDGKKYCANNKSGIIMKEYSSDDILDCNGFKIEGDYQNQPMAMSVGGSANYFDWGVRSRAFDNQTIVNCVISGFDGGIGPYFRKGSVIENITAYINTAGIFGISQENAVIRGAHLFNNIFGIIIDELILVTIENNLIENNSYAGIFLVNRHIPNLAPDGDRHIIRNNTLRNNNIAISSDSFNNLFEDNKITDNGIGLDFWGIIPWLKDDNLLLTNNVFVRNNFSGNNQDLNYLEDYNDYFYLYTDVQLSKLKENFDNTNFFDGKNIMFNTFIKNEFYSGLDLEEFICVACSDITILDSSIKDLLLLGTKNSTFKNIQAVNGDYGYNLFLSSQNNTFVNFTITESKHLSNCSLYSTNNHFYPAYYCNGRNDSDGDRTCDEEDSCPMIHNPLQEDYNSNGIGDACDSFWPPDQPLCFGDTNKDGIVNPSDFTVIRNFKNTGIICDMVNNWCSWGDINRDRIVDDTDNDLIMQRIGERCVCPETPEICDGFDNDCNMIIPANEIDSDGNG